MFGEPEDLGPVRVLLIGAAGCSLVKYFIAHYPEGRMDVVELHREMIEAARMYFYLGELEENLQVAHMDRLRIYISDGMKYLDRFVAQGKQPRYDMIINDAYIGDH
ncbi:MAG: hypothetical protein IJT34_11490, partial [Butyrivibrio sp.]|nr:hypothetical protein [Butyrivibrio sp.]